MLDVAGGIRCQVSEKEHMYDMPDCLNESTGSYFLVYIGPDEGHGTGEYYLFRVPEKGKAGYANNDGAETLSLSHGNAWGLSVYENGGVFIKSEGVKKEGESTRIVRPLSSEMLVVSGTLAHQTIFSWLFPDLDGQVVMPQDAKRGDKKEHELESGKQGKTFGHMRSGKGIYESMSTQYEEDFPYAGSPILVRDGPYDRDLSGDAYLFMMPISTDDIEHETYDGTETLRPVSKGVWDLKGLGILKLVFEETEHESNGEIVGKSFGIKSREKINEIVRPVSGQVCVLSGSAAVDNIFDGLLSSLYPRYTE